MAGEANALTLACACRYLTSFRQTGHFGKAWGRVSVSKVEDTLKKYPALRDSAHFSTLHNREFSLGSPSLVCTLHFLFSEVDDAAAGYFFDRLFSGADLASGNPILQLRNLIGKNRTAPVRYSVDTIGRYCVKAWNLYCSGDWKTQLRIDDREDLTQLNKPEADFFRKLK